MDEERARDILSQREQQTDKSAAIRELIRNEMGQWSVTLEDVYRAVTELERRMAAGQVSFNGADQPDSVLDEPADAAAALDYLGL